MDRLDRILHAEERANKELESAREQARSLASEAKSESDLILSTAEREARQEAERIVEKSRSRTAREAEEYSQQAAADMRAEIREAEGRFDRAVAAVVAELAG
jgi:vacuolar-type H+-ATPase subunit H